MKLLKSNQSNDSSEFSTTYSFHWKITVKKFLEEFQESLPGTMSTFDVGKRSPGKRLGLRGSYNNTAPGFVKTKISPKKFKYNLKNLDKIGICM